ncbi:MAG: hypothetical protein ABSD32_15655 [Mycobacterium sp.]
MTVSVVGLTTDTVLLLVLVTKTSPAAGPTGLTAAPCGPVLMVVPLRPLIPFGRSARRCRR